MIDSGVSAERSDLFENFPSNNKHRLRPVPSRIQPQIQGTYSFVVVFPFHSEVVPRTHCSLPKMYDERNFIIGCSVVVTNKQNIEKPPSFTPRKNNENNSYSPRFFLVLLKYSANPGCLVCVFFASAEFRHLFPYTETGTWTTVLEET
jgi:hypothetical protein